jgi:uncharacterized protein
MNELIGRSAEKAILKDALRSTQAELIAVYGRRRVGKTYLIETVCAEQILFMFSGGKQVALDVQLDNFCSAMHRALQPEALGTFATAKNWNEAFRTLVQLLEKHKSEQKRVLFLDEFPWLDQKKSGFLAAFDHFWNNWATRQNWLVVVICGSAASWMIQNVVRNKGGLHNRLTQRIRLRPFNLHETALFLESKHIRLSRYDILQLYMVTGGIPHYLRSIKPGESVAQTIDRLCFTKDGWLSIEFKELYPALFGGAKKHMTVIRALADKQSGLSRSEILERGQFSSGGTVTKVLEELEESGFITAYMPFGKQAKDAIYKLTDEYSLFYLKFIEGSKVKGQGAWQKVSATQSWVSWRGLAFEHLCLKHIEQVKKALGIAGIYTEESVWRHIGRDQDQGVQIDLLIDRQDNVINLCELKYYSKDWSITAVESDGLETKRRVFQKKTGTRKTIFITLITTYGVTTNEYYLQTIQNQVTIDALFESV